MKNKKQINNKKQKLKKSDSSFKMLLGLILFFFILTPFHAQSQTQPTHFDPVEFDAYVQQAMQDWDVPGLSIAVIKDDEVVFLKGYGVPEIGKPGVVDENTLFAAGSTTKAFTAAAIGMLVDEGKLEWDDPVVKHVPSFRLADPYLTANITVRDLLTHRAGLPNTGYLWLTKITAQEMFERLIHVEPVYPLRDGFIYQNIMYALAGQVVENVSGMSWNNFVEKRIFEPLGMDKSTTRLTEARKKENVVSPHDYVENQLKPVQTSSADEIGAAGSIWSSAADMSQWISFLLRDCQTVEGKPLLEKATCTELFTPQVILKDPYYPPAKLTDPNWTTYGLAWFQEEFEGRKIDFHTGSLPGLVAIAGMIRDENIGVYVLANRDHAELRHALMYRVFDLFDDEPARDWSKELKELYDDRDEKRKAAIAKMDSTAIAERILKTKHILPLESYTGIYKDPLYGKVEITKEDSQLRFEYGWLEGKLEHWHYDTFRLIEDNPIYLPPLVKFDLNTFGKPESVTLRLMEDMEFEKVEEEKE